jgi:hypothetical protein
MRDASMALYSQRFALLLKLDSALRDAMREQLPSSILRCRVVVDRGAQRDHRRKQATLSSIYASGVPWMVGKLRRDGLQPDRR